jgi:hypothetical protein
MESMRESWTDQRLDDFRVDVDKRFDRIEGEIQILRGEMRHGFERVDERFESLYRLLLQLGGAVIVALLGLIATQI